MDFVVITDHDTIDGALDLLSSRPELEPEVIVGEEVETHFPDTGQWAHVNVFDVDEAIHRDLEHLRPNVHELVGYLRSRGLVHVLNHPFQSYRVQKRGLAFIEDVLQLFDLFEVGNATLSSRHNKAVAEMLEFAAAFHTRKMGVGGSDAHNIRNIGLYWTEAPVTPEASDKRSWLAAIARGEGRASGRSIGALGLTGNVYHIVGQYYLSLLDPRMRRNMSGVNYLAAAGFLPACLAGLPAFLNLGNTLRLEAVTLYLRRCLRQADPLARTALREAGLAEDPPG